MVSLIVFNRDTPQVIIWAVKIFDMKNIFKLIIPVALLLNTPLAIVGAETSLDNGSLHAVNASNGIDKAEAQIIAEVYFYYQISSCGYAAEPESDVENWISKTRIGVVGKAGPPILINKQTGDIFWEEPTNSMSLESLKRAKTNLDQMASEK